MTNDIYANIELLCVMAPVHVIPELEKFMDNFYDYCFGLNSSPSFRAIYDYMLRIESKYDPAKVDYASDKFYDLWEFTKGEIHHGLQYGYLQ